jgi:hypothetical protein
MRFSLASALTYVFAFSFAARAAAPATATVATKATVPAPEPKKAVPFIEDDYKRALAEAKAKKRPLFIEAWAPW